MPTGLSFAERGRLWGANEMYPWLSPTADSITANVVTGRFGFGKAINLTGASGNGVNQFYAFPLGGTKTEVYVGVAVKWDNITSYTSGGCIGFFDAVNQQFQFTVRLDKFGVIRVIQGPTNPATPWGNLPFYGPPTVLATSVMGVFQENEDFYLEIHGIIDDTSGEVEVRVNTVTVISAVNIDTRGGTLSTTIDAITLGWLSSGAPGSWNVSYDDLYVNDTAGLTCNSWMGNQRVKSQFVIGDGSTLDFTIGGTSPAATHWQSVLNQNLDDTKFVYSPTVGDIDLYQIDPNLNSPLVNVLQVRSALRQDDSTQRAAQHLVHISGVDYLNPLVHYTNQSYTFYKSRWEVNPDTGVGFTGAEVNGLQPGIDVSI